MLDEMSQGQKPSSSRHDKLLMDWVPSYRECTELVVRQSACRDEL